MPVLEEAGTMWPWGHAAFGYLAFYLGRRSRGRPWPPTDVDAVVLFFGTQFPDIVDKPLAWTFGVLPSGRSLAHSALVAAFVVGVVLLVARREGHSSTGWAFAVGYFSHLLGDALDPLLEWNVEFLSFLAWPLLPPPPYEGDASFSYYVFNLAPTPQVVFGLALALLVVGLWARDGFPGLRWAFDSRGEPVTDD